MLIQIVQSVEGDILLVDGTNNFGGDFLELVQRVEGLPLAGGHHFAEGKDFLKIGKLNFKKTQ